MTRRRTWVGPLPAGEDLKMKSSLPQDLTKLTAEQAEWCVAYHAALPLAEIRRRQTLADQQIGMAWRQRNDFAINNLRVMEELLRRGAERKLPPANAPARRRKKWRKAIIASDS